MDITVGSPENKVKAIYAEKVVADQITSHALGDIVWTSNPTPVVGRLIANGAEVSRAMYPDYNEQQAKLGYPWGAGNGSTTFNLPNLIGRFPEGATSAGGYHGAGLPNIEGGLNDDLIILSLHTDGKDHKDGALTLSYYANNLSAPTGNSLARKLKLNASDSNPIYGRSNTVQPASALLIPYVVVFTEATPDSALVDMTQVANDLAGKANRSLSNLTQETNDKLKAMAFPSATRVNLSSIIGGLNKTYTFPANGYLYYNIRLSDTNGGAVDFRVNNGLSQNAAGTITTVKILPVRKGDSVKTTRYDAVSIFETYFIYAEGEV